MRHTIELKIYYEDTDVGGVVYYANYLCYMERARTEYMAERGVPIKDLMEQGIFFLIARVEIDYRSPGRYGDTIVVETWVPDLAAATVTFSHVMKEKSSGRLIAECMAKAVCVDRSNRPRRIPRDVAAKLKDE